MIAFVQIHVWFLCIRGFSFFFSLTRFIHFHVSCMGSYFSHERILYHQISHLDVPWWNAPLCRFFPSRDLFFHRSGNIRNIWNLFRYPITLRYSLILRVFYDQRDKWSMMWTSQGLNLEKKIRTKTNIWKSATFRLRLMEICFHWLKNKKKTYPHKTLHRQTISTLMHCKLYNFLYNTWLLGGIIYAQINESLRHVAVRICPWITLNNRVYTCIPATTTFPVYEVYCCSNL